MQAQPTAKGNKTSYSKDATRPNYIDDRAPKFYMPTQGLPHHISIHTPALPNSLAGPRWYTDASIQPDRSNNSRKSWTRNATDTSSTITRFVPPHTGADDPGHYGGNGGGSSTNSWCIVNKTTTAALCYFLNRQPSNGLLQLTGFVQSSQMAHQNNHCNFPEDSTTVPVQGLQNPTIREHYSSQFNSDKF